MRGARYRRHRRPHARAPALPRRRARGPASRRSAAAAAASRCAARRSAARSIATTPSCIASRPQRRFVTGDRSSCATSLTICRFTRSVRARRSAISLKARRQARDLVVSARGDADVEVALPHPVRGRGQLADGAQDPPRQREREQQRHRGRADRDRDPRRKTSRPGDGRASIVRQDVDAARLEAFTVADGKGRDAAKLHGRARAGAAAVQGHVSGRIRSRHRDRLELRRRGGDRPVARVDGDESHAKPTGA